MTSGSSPTSHIPLKDSLLFFCTLRVLKTGAYLKAHTQLNGARLSLQLHPAIFLPKFCLLFSHALTQKLPTPSLKTISSSLCQTSQLVSWRVTDSQCTSRGSVCHPRQTCPFGLSTALHTWLKRGKRHMVHFLSLFSTFFSTNTY